MADVFLSYKREDREKVRPLVQALQEQGWSVWWDTRIRVSEIWDEVIERELKAARCIVVVWSPLSVESTWVRSEAHEGLERGCLAPVIMGNVRQPLAFKLVQAVDLSRWRGSRKDEGFALLCEKIASVAGRVEQLPHHPSRWQAFLAWAVRKPVLASICAGVVALALVGYALSGVRDAGSPPDLAKTDCQLTRAIAAAIKACADTIKRFPKLADAYVARGEAHRKAKRYQPALADFSAALDLESRPLLALARRAMTYEESGAKDKSGADYDGVIATIPRTVGDHVARCDAYISKSEFDRAIPECNRAIELDATQAFTYQLRAFAFHNLDKGDRAVADLNRAIDLDPHFASAYFDRGNVRYATEQERAFEDYSKAIGIDKNYSSAYHNRGQIYVLKKDMDNAIADFTKAIELDPAFVAALLRRADTYRENRDFDRAIADYSKVIELEPDNASYYAARCEAYNSKDDYNNAQADCAKALRIDPNSGQAYNSRGNTSFLKKEYDQAIEDYTRSARLLPKDPMPLSNRGLTYQTRNRPGDRDRAIADFRGALALSPSWEPAKRGLKELGMVQ